MGNANSGPKREKPFRDALILALKDAAEDKRSLRKVAESVIDEAIKGNMAAAKEIGDRLDGKPAQAIIGGEESDAPVKVTFEWLKPSET